MELSWLLLLASLVILFFTLTRRSRDAARLESVELATTELRFHLGHLGQRLSSVEWKAASWTPPAWTPSGRNSGFDAPSPFRSAPAVDEHAPREAPAGRARPPAFERAEPALPEAPASEAAAREAIAPRDPASSPPAAAAERPSQTIDARSEARLDPDEEPNAAVEGELSWDWERWIGVRGAAALGAGVLVVALLYFLRFSIDQGWLTPAMRVGLGVLVSGGCIAAAELRLRDVHPVMAAWLSGAGLAGLFASTWAAQAVVGLIGAGVAFAVFIGLTAATLTLAARRASLPVALLGLSGGFAAPLGLLGFEVTASALAGRAPMVLSYVLLLDVAMIVLSARRRWWVLAVLSLLVSSAYLGVWLQASAGHGELAVQVALLTVFAAVFGALPAFVAGLADDHPLARVVRVGAVSVPVAFSLFLLAQPAVLARPLPIGVLLVLVTGMSIALAARYSDKVGPLIASSGSLIVLGVWLLRADVSAHMPELAALLAILAALFVYAPSVLWRLLATSDDATGTANAATWGSTALFLGGATLYAVAASIAAPQGWPLGVFTLVGLSALTLHFAHRSGVRAVATTNVHASSVGLLAIAAAGTPAWTGGPQGLEPATAFALEALCLVGLFALARRTKGSLGEELVGAVRGASGLMLVGVSLLDARLSVAGHVAALVAFACLGLATLRGRATQFLLFGMLALGSVVVLHYTHGAQGHPTLLAVLVAAGFGAAALSAQVGLRREDALHGQTGVLVGAALVPVLTNPGAWSGAAPTWLALAVVAVALLVVDRLRARSSEVADRDVAAWLGAFAAASLTAIAFVTWSGSPRLVAVSLLGLALIGTHRMAGTPMYLWLGVVELGYSVVRALSPRTILPHESSLRDGSMLQLVVAAVACLAAWALLRAPDTAARSDRAPLRALLGSAGLMLGFFVVSNAFAHLPALLGFELAQAGDLSQSLAWAGYGLLLLLVGVRLESSAHRWVSLVLVLATAAKVFLYDLGRLGDLYRVASLVGLAFSLLAISLLYQRLVFRTAPRARTGS